MKDRAEKETRHDELLAELNATHEHIKLNMMPLFRLLKNPVSFNQGGILTTRKPVDAELPQPADMDHALSAFFNYYGNILGKIDTKLMEASGALTLKLNQSLHTQQPIIKKLATLFPLTEQLQNAWITYFPALETWGEDILKSDIYKGQLEELGVMHNTLMGMLKRGKQLHTVASQGELPLETHQTGRQM